jgi:uncharacterized integral membrane protein
MPWRLIGFILALVIITAFIGFNLDNACNVSFGFLHLEQVPVYLTVFSSFVAGMIVVLPFAFGRSMKRKKVSSSSRGAKAAYPADISARASRRGRSRPSEAELDDGAYGVD